MRNKNIRPYLSVAFANRNDLYAGDQEVRIRTFIDFYSYYDQKYPGLLEFIICDWNPPDNQTSLKDQYDWSKLRQVKHLVVSPEIHAKLCPDNSRPILEYIGRNACIRRAAAPFILVLNQDIFLSSSIFKFLSKRCLSDKYFYRADRCDFRYDYKEDFSNWEVFDAYAKKYVMARHIRPRVFWNEISPSINAKSYGKVYTRKKMFEYKRNDIIYSDFYTYLKSFCKFVHKIVPFSNAILSYKIFSLHAYKMFFLHTNASGDFLIASKKAFFNINGFVETGDFYMHLDSYMCVQLFAAGYRQGILAYPHTVFHSHHSRSMREGRPESLTYLEHAKIFVDICLGKKPYTMNPVSWGLKNFSLSEVR